MRVEKEYRQLEGIEEIRIFNASQNDFYKPVPKEFDVEDLEFQELINNLPIRKTCCFIDGNTSDALIDASLVLKHMDSH